MTDIKKAIAFIKSNAKETPAITRSGFEIPKEIVAEIKEQIAINDGSFVLPSKAVNELFGWKQDANRGSYLKVKLNKQYPLTDGLVWHIGYIAKGTLYCFEERKAVVQEKQEGQD